MTESEANGWALVVILAVVGLGLWLTERRAKRRRDDRATAVRRCQVPPLAPRENVIRLTPTGIGGIR